MAPPPASPTSLLWAHQLKREHGYILKRLQDLEATRESHENRIKSAEQAAKASANNNISALANQVNALEGGNWQNRLTELETNITERFNNIEADTEAMTLQMDVLERKQDAQEVGVQKALKDGEALLNRIREVDETLQKYRDASTRIGKRIDEAAIGQIKLQLDGLAKQVQQEGSDFKSIFESITQMETAQGQLRKAIEKLESDFKKKAAKTSTTPKASQSKPVTGPAIKDKPEGEPRKKAANTPEHTTTKQFPDTGTPDSAKRDPSKRKSHKWSGGGADRDIIRQGSDVKKAIPAKTPQFGTETSEQRPESSKKTPHPPQPKAKKRVPPARPDGPPVKSHKWAGGGADRDIIAAGVSSHVSDLKRKRSRSMGDELEQPRMRGGARASEGVVKPTSQSPAPVDSSKTKTQRWAESQTTKSITRAGKGWFEVIASPEPEPSSAPVKRGRGRPRKSTMAQIANQELLIEPRRTRRAIIQDDEDPKPKVSRKRKAAAEAEDSVDESEFNHQTKTARIATPREKLHRTSVFQLPPSPVALNKSEDDLDEGEPRPAQPRRQIVQDV